MNPNSAYWMNYAIGLAERAPQPGRKVGVALVSEDDRLICPAFEGEERGASWYHILRRKLQELGESRAHTLYLTINTLSGDHSFDLAELLKEVRVDKIYIGLPDPALTTYLDDDPATTSREVYRFPDDLQREILKQNRRLYAVSEQSIVCNPYYFKHRIGEAVYSSLGSKGFTLSRSEVNTHRQRFALASLICKRYRVEHEVADRAVYDALSEAFDAKYGSYDYTNDARSVNPNWAEEFKSVYKSSATMPLPTANILNVGVGGGHEAETLFSDCPQITFVDIAQSGLHSAQQRVPLSRVIVSSADDLSALPEDHYDLYVSLRTYNSSFFDPARAASEAHRILKPGAAIIVSVANGFLSTERENSVVPGLILPDTDFVDLYRGLNSARSIRAELGNVGFEDIRMTATETEIYLSGVAT
ncbi:class I SAM-dependent methyltransferase [Saccharothrix luteola]|uniref:class I SAM-dependent methyltransferase n=1 Tax=Saccharothrix luteola TaxID=2893018 RepID=UPI001E3CAA57|nr:class I SAM-dependent methyltransferase [Saccharothrix luteola]MCC8250534.1 class I SAM-dependent methyltransferase [Saccharothrix luteola]